MRDQNSENSKAGPTMAAMVVERLTGFFPRAAASDPEVFLAGAVHLLADYPPWVLEQTISVRHGLPSKHEFLPSLATIKAFCDALVTEDERHRGVIERNTRPRLSAPGIDRSNWPSVEELKAKYGPNWGLRAAELGPKERQWIPEGELRQQVGDAAFDRIPNGRETWRKAKPAETERPPGYKRAAS